MLQRQRCPLTPTEVIKARWKPVWNILGDGGFDLVLANAAHITVPGRKTDKRKMAVMLNGRARDRLAATAMA